MVFASFLFYTTTAPAATFAGMDSYHSPLTHTVLADSLQIRNRRCLIIGSLRALDKIVKIWRYFFLLSYLTAQQCTRIKEPKPHDI